MDKSITSNEVESVIKNLPTRKTKTKTKNKKATTTTNNNPAPDGFSGEFYQRLKN